MGLVTVDGNIKRGPNPPSVPFSLVSRLDSSAVKLFLPHNCLIGFKTSVDSNFMIPLSNVSYCVSFFSVTSNLTLPHSSLTWFLSSYFNCHYISPQNRTNSLNSTRSCFLDHWSKLFVFFWIPLCWSTFCFEANLLLSFGYFWKFKLWLMASWLYFVLITVASFQLCLFYTTGAHL